MKTHLLPQRIAVLTLSLGLGLGGTLPWMTAQAESKATASAEASSEASVQHIRKVFNEIQTAVEKKQYKKVTAEHHDDPLVFELTGWFEGRTLRKITAFLPGEDGGGYEDYYFDSNGSLIFVYNTYTEMSENNREAKIENRFYFKGNDITRWKMDGRANPEITSADRKSERDRLTGNARDFKAALEKKI